MIFKGAYAGSHNIYFARNASKIQYFLKSDFHNQSIAGTTNFFW